LRPASRRKRPTGIKRRSAKRSFSSTTQGNTIEMRIPNVEVEKAFENFAGIVNQARVVPYMVNGAPQGFQIRKIVPGSIFERLGLTNGDIIKSVNGESLTTADKALRLFTVFRNEREINLEIERGSKPIVLSYIVE
jgi:general secretion pathway protein C